MKARFQLVPFVAARLCAEIRLSDTQIAVLGLPASLRQLVNTGVRLAWFLPWYWLNTEEGLQ